MLDHIRGTIRVLDAQQGIARSVVSMDAIGFGFHVTLAQAGFDAFAGEQIVYVAAVGERHDLYGFASRERRDDFVFMLRVKGIGPKTAMRIAASLPPDRSKWTPAIIASAGHVKLPVATEIAKALRAQ